MLACFLNRFGHLSGPSVRCYNEAMKEKSTMGVTVLGMVCVILGAVWLVASFWGFLQVETVRVETERAGAPQLLTEATVWIPYVDAAANAVLAAVLFIAGTGLLKFREWGRKLGIGYAWARICWSIVAFVLAFIGPYSRQAPIPEGEMYDVYRTFMEFRFAAVARTGMLAALLLSVAFAVIVLCLLKRESYRQAVS